MILVYHLDEMILVYHLDEMILIYYCIVYLMELLIIIAILLTLIYIALSTKTENYQTTTATATSTKSPSEVLYNKTQMQELKYNPKEDQQFNYLTETNGRDLKNSYRNSPELL